MIKSDIRTVNRIIAQLNADICDRLNITIEELDSMSIHDVEKSIEKKCGGMWLPVARRYV